MRRSCAVLLVLAALTATVSAGGDPTEMIPAYNKALAEQNLLAGLASENSGLQRSCALMLGQIGSQKATIALMAKLRSSQDESVRIASAWALSRIGDPFGTYLVRMTVSYDESAKIRAYCAWYYNVNVKPGSFIIRELPEAVPVVALRWSPEPIAD